MRESLDLTDTDHRGIAAALPHLLRQPLKPLEMARCVRQQVRRRFEGNCAKALELAPQADAFGAAPGRQTVKKQEPFRRTWRHTGRLGACNRYFNLKRLERVPSLRP